MFELSPTVWGDVFFIPQPQVLGPLQDVIALIHQGAMLSLANLIDRICHEARDMIPIEGNLSVLDTPKHRQNHHSETQALYHILYAPTQMCDAPVL
jgi:hypothetical protein